MDYYTIRFLLHRYHKYDYNVIDGMAPFELLIEISLCEVYMKKEKEVKSDVRYDQ